MYFKEYELFVCAGILDEWNQHSLKSFLYFFNFVLVMGFRFTTFQALFTKEAFVKIFLKIQICIGQNKKKIIVNLKC
jgi:hypothetical protein